MQVWPVLLPSDAPPAASGLIDCIARPDFGTRALARLNQTLPVAWWKVYKLFDDRPPQLCTLGHHGVPDIALDCWQLYRTGLYRDDRSLLQARAITKVRHVTQAQDLGGAAMAARPVAMTHNLPGDFGRAHREQIYRRYGLGERLSVVGTDADGALVAVNLYRHHEQPRFDAAEMSRVRDLAGSLLAVVQRHLELTAPARHDIQSTAAALRQCGAGLTDREHEVCERLLRGWTHEGIAADLNLAASTVKTYRNRAFERLGIHHRNELFGLVLGTARDA